MISILNPYKFSVLHVAILWSVCSLTASAKVREAGTEKEYKTACEAIHAAEPGDVILLSSETFSGACAWTTPGLTIRGSSADSIVGLEADRTTWQIVSNDTVIENVAFVGSAQGDTTGAAIQQVGGNLTLRQVRIEGAAIGVESLELNGGVLTIEQSEISRNQRNVVVDRIEEFNLYSSYVHDAKGGDSIETGAVRNNIRENKLTSAEAGTRSEVVIRDSEHSTVAGNLIDRSGQDENSVFVQYVSEADATGAIEIIGNTFVAGSAGTLFVEAAGTVMPRTQIEKNVFWGGVIAESFGRDLAGQNFFGDAPQLSRKGETVLAPEGIPSDWGAPARLLGSIADYESEPQVSRKTTELAAVATPTLQSIVLSQTNFVGGSYFKATVYLTSAAPAGGKYVTISSSNTAVAYPMIPTIWVPLGATSAPVVIFSKTVSGTTTVTIRASLGGLSKSATATVTGVALLSVTLEKPEVGSNGKLTLNRVNLNGPAPAGGMVVYLSESSAFASVPTSVFIVGGARSVNFTITAGAVSSPQPVTITARYSTTQRTATIKVMPQGLEKLEVSPTTLYGGQMLILKASLNAPTTTAMTIYLTSSDPCITLPVSVVALAGKTYGSAITFAKAVSSPRTVTISARTGSTTKSQVVTVIPKP